MAGPFRPAHSDGTTMHTEPTGTSIVESAYLVHASPLRGRMTMLTRDPTAAEDLMQEAFVRLLLEVDAGRVPDDIGAWLHRVAHNLAMSRGRRLSVVARHRDAVATPEPPRSPEAIVVAAESESVVCRAVESLGATDRQAMILAAHGYRGAEIGRLMGRTDGAVRTILCRARAKVRQQVGAMEAS